MAVDTFDVSASTDKAGLLIKEALEARNWPALEFVSSPDKANELATEFVSQDASVGAGQALADWMAENYGAKWELSEAVASGLAVHHGRIPRALASRFVKMFNDKKLPILICTSTLIEGVNTAAKTVLIFDKTINSSNYDFFTFSNIRGRAGRLGQHFVGQVYLFNVPPRTQDVDIDAPLFGDLDDAPEELMVHVAGEEASSELNEKVDELAEKLGLSVEELRRHSGLGMDQLEKLKDEVQEALPRGKIIWSGRPDFDNIWAVCEVICKVRRAVVFGCGSAKQLAYYINRLRNEGRMKRFFAWHSETYKGKPVRMDNIFKFLRAAEYSLPEYFAVVEMFAKKVKPDVSYTQFLGGLPRWFRSEVLKILEEQGVPIQISERFLRRDDTVTSLGRRLQHEARAKSDKLSDLERSWILDALPT